MPNTLKTTKSKMIKNTILAVVITALVTASVCLLPNTMSYSKAYSVLAKNDCTLITRDDCTYVYISRTPSIEVLDAISTLAELTEGLHIETNETPISND